jgi:hypothetical protein
MRRRRDRTTDVAAADTHTKIRKIDDQIMDKKLFGYQVRAEGKSLFIWKLFPRDPI